MSEASKTPRTDAWERELVIDSGYPDAYHKCLALARTLELELTALREELEATRARLAEAQAKLQEHDK